MLLIKYKGRFPAPISLPAVFKLLASGTYILCDGNLSDYTNQQITQYHIVEIIDSMLIAQLELNVHTIHTDGTVRLYGTGENWLSEPIIGADLLNFLSGAKFIAKLNASIAFDMRFNALSIGESALEQATWPQQQAEATAYLAAGTPPTLLTQLAEARNLTVEQYAQKVVAASTAYSNLVNTLVAELKAQYQLIDIAATPQTLKDTGWL
jgi:hypothetical protein